MRSTLCCARVESQNAYQDHECPVEICITYHPHPLFERRLSVVRSIRYRSEVHWVVVLPDGSHCAVRSSWTDCPIGRGVIAPQPSKAPTRALRDLACLLEALVCSASVINASRDPTQGGRDDSATQSVRDRDRSLGRAPVEHDRRREASRGSHGSRRDGPRRSGRTIPSQKGGQEA